MKLKFKEINNTVFGKSKKSKNVDLGNYGGKNQTQKYAHIFWKPHATSVVPIYRLKRYLRKSYNFNYK